MTIQKGIDGRRYAVFKDEEEAESWEWLWWKTLGCPVVCFNGYYNAYLLNP